MPDRDTERVARHLAPDKGAFDKKFNKLAAMRMSDDLEIPTNCCEGLAKNFREDHLMDKHDSGTRGVD